MEFGGDWTIKKLNVLERYLDAYTTALKNKRFNLVYIDAFAGDGTVELEEPDPGFNRVVDGSARLAVKVRDKQFDRLVFIEKSSRRCQELTSLKNTNPTRDVRIAQGDANEVLRRLDLDWSKWRGVLFVDPFATEVQWTTIQTIASFNALDMWLLFPLSAIARMLPTTKQPRDVDPKWAVRLDRTYGDQSWQDLYDERSQLTLFGKPGVERDPGVEGLLEIYKENLKGVFGNRLLDTSCTLSTVNNAPLFELMFCVGNPSGIRPAKDIAQHILEHI